MMRHLTAISTGLAVVLVAPGTVLGGEDLAMLQTALEDTVRSIEALTGLQKQEAITPSLAITITEAPALEPQAGDERLQGLRNEVSLLQMQLDALQGLPVGFLAPEEPPAVAATGMPPMPTTTGLSDELREELARLARPSAGPRTLATSGTKPTPLAPSSAAENTTPGGTEGPATASAEAPSADPVSEGRACFYAGLHDRALELLSPLETNAEALYWKARNLEKLERTDEAIVALKAAVRLAGDSYEGKRAKADLEFLQWKREFLKKVARSNGGRP